MAVPRYWCRSQSVFKATDVVRLSLLSLTLTRMLLPCVGREHLTYVVNCICASRVPSGVTVRVLIQHAHSNTPVIYVTLSDDSLSKLRNQIHECFCRACRSRPIFFGLLQLMRSAAEQLPPP